MSNKHGTRFTGHFPEPLLGDPTDPKLLTQQSVLAYSLGAKTVTKADGNRYIVNEGSAGGEYALNSGQGLKGGGTQYIDTEEISYDFFVNNDWTLLFTSIDTALDVNPKIWFGSADMQVREDYLNIWDGTVSTRVSFNEVGGILNGSYGIRHKFDGTNHTYNLTKNGSVVNELVTTVVPMEVPSNVATKLQLFGRTQIPSFSTTTLKDVYLIPKYLTELEIEVHNQNPEYTIYLQSGIVKSAFLAQSVLDEMNSGNWFAYPLCENNNAGNSVYDISKQPSKENIVFNYTDSMRANATMLSVGLQQSLLETDGVGKLTGLQGRGVLKFDGKSYVDLSGITVNSSWCLDLYASSREIPQTGYGSILDATCFNASAVETGKIEIGVTDLSSTLYVKANADTFHLAIEQGVISFEAVNGIVSVYVGGTLEGTATTSFDNVKLNTLGGVLASLVHGTVAGFRISNIARTSEERLTAVSAIEARRNLPQFDSYSVLTTDFYEILTTDGYTVATLAE